MNKEELKADAKKFLINHQNITSSIAKETIYDGYIDCMIDYATSQTEALKKEIEELKVINNDALFHIKVLLASMDGTLDAYRTEYGETYLESDCSLKAKEFLKSLTPPKQ